MGSGPSRGAALDTKMEVHPPVSLVLPKPPMGGNPQIDALVANMVKMVVEKSVDAFVKQQRLAKNAAKAAAEAEAMQGGAEAAGATAKAPDCQVGEYSLLIHYPQPPRHTPVTGRVTMFKETYLISLLVCLLHASSAMYQIPGRVLLRGAICNADRSIWGGVGVDVSQHT